MSTCTHTGCTAAATTPRVAKDGSTWANLCDEHSAAQDAREQAVAAGGGKDALKALLGGWVRAQGGPKAAADRVLGRRR